IPTHSGPGEGGSALVAQTEHLSVLRSRRDSNNRRPIDCRHLHFCAERRLRKRDRQHAAKVVAHSSKESVRGHIRNHKQIARPPAESAGIAAAAETNARSSTHTGGNFHVDDIRSFDATLPSALMAAGRPVTYAAAVRARRRKLQAALGALNNTR